MKKEVRYGDLGLGTLNHILYTPENEMEDVPLLVYLHGAGERGNNTEHLKRHAVPKMIEEGYEIPAIVLCPQCPAQYVWNNVVREVKMLIDEIVREFSISKDSICLTGSSMGGLRYMGDGTDLSQFLCRYRTCLRRSHAMESSKSKNHACGYLARE